MTHCCSGRGGDRRFARSQPVLVSTICAVLGLELGAPGVAPAGSTYSIATIPIARRYEYLLVSHTAEGARWHWLRFAIARQGTLGVIRGDRDFRLGSAAPLADPDADPEPDPVLRIVAPDSLLTPGVRTSALAASDLEAVVSGVAPAAPEGRILSSELDSSPLRNWRRFALEGLAGTKPPREVRDAYEGIESTHRGAGSAAAPTPPVEFANDEAPGSSMPTPLRVIATALESVAILAYGRRAFHR